MEFFFFYGFVYDSSEWVIDVPNAEFSPRRERTQRTRNDSAFLIKDPFDVYHDPGKAVKRGSREHRIIVSEFCQGIDSLRKGIELF